MPQFQRIGPVFATLVGLVSASLSIGAPAFAADKLGVVLLHGEQGAPGIAIAGLAASLEKAGHLVSRPDMCWSARRADQVRFEECLAAIDTAIVRLRNLGASRIVVGGFGLGATAAIVYGAGHPGLQGIIALAPGHNAHALADDPDIAASIARAKALAAEGKGDTEASFEEIGIGPSGFYLTEIATTPEIYLSFFGRRHRLWSPAISRSFRRRSSSSTGRTIRRNRRTTPRSSPKRRGRSSTATPPWRAIVLASRTPRRIS